MAGQSVTVEAYCALVGQEIGTSPWILVDQARIDTFADCTDDRQFIHVDPERAARSPFGGTIAHGFLSLSLLSAMSFAVNPAIQGMEVSINYGFDKVRFLTPVAAGCRVRARFTLLRAMRRNDGGIQSVMEAVVEVEGQARPAVVAEWITLTLS